MSIYDIKFTDNLPSKGIKDIPPSDNILPNIFAQIPLSSSPAQTTQPTLNNTNVSTLNLEVTPQACFDYAKNCRDIQCAFKDFNFDCNKKGPVCTCGASSVSGASSILSNPLLPIAISFIISFYYYI